MFYNLMLQKRTLNHGTTTASYYATIHVDSTVVLAEQCIKYGQRAFVGKVNMVERCPPYYRETNESSIADTEEVIQKILAKNVNIT